MKPINLLFFAAIISFSVIGCGDKDKIQQLESKAERLRMDSLILDSTLSDLAISMQKFDENISNIAEKENYISMVMEGDESAMTEDIRERIQRNLNFIDQRLIERKQEVEKLEKKIASLSAVKKKNSSLKALIESYKKRILEKDAEISSLKVDLEKANILITDLTKEVDELQMTVEEKEALLARQQEEMNTGFYIYGTYKELKQQGILEKDGGFLGIGRQKILANDFSKDYFNRLDITQGKTIYLTASKAEVVTPHPEGTYTLVPGEDNGMNFTITDPINFWKNSKHLVIVIK